MTRCRTFPPPTPPWFRPTRVTAVDRDLGRLPDHPNVFVTLGAAHGFKFASLFGRIIAELVADGRTASQGEIERFRIDRPILLEANPVTSFMV